MSTLPVNPARSAATAYSRRYRPTGRGHAVAPFFLAATLYFLIGGSLALLRQAPGPGFPTLAAWHWPLVHLLLVGGVTQLIIGAMGFFAVTLLRTDAPPIWLTRGQWLLVNVGALGLVGGVLTGRAEVGVAGGLAVLGALGLLLVTLGLLRRRALVAPDATFVYYLAAIGCLLVGVMLGLLMLSGWFVWLPLPYGQLRLAHLHVNLSGWVMLTIIGTMRLFFSTTLGVPARHLNPLWREFWPLAAGVVLTTFGWLIGAMALVGLGSFLQLLGTLAYVMAITRQWRAAPRGPLSVPAAHLLAATGWLAMLTLGGAAAVGARMFDPMLGAAGLRAVAAATFVGFIGQTILGAWTHLFSIIAALPAAPWPPLAAPLRPRLRAILNGYGPWQIALANIGAAGIVLGELLAPLLPSATWATTAGLASLAGLLVLIAVKAVRVVALIVRLRWAVRDGSAPASDAGATTEQLGPADTFPPAGLPSAVQHETPITPAAAAPANPASAAARPSGDHLGGWQPVLARPLLVLAALGLGAGVWGGLLRLGWALPLQPAAIAWHGALVVGGFLGVLIGVERALALGRRWPFAAPLLTGLGAGSLLIGLPLPVGASLMTLGSLGMVLTNLAIIQRHLAGFTLTMGLGAVCWSIGNLLWLAGWPAPRLMLWWAAFLVLTIAGERLDLTRLRRPSPLTRRLFVVALGLPIAGVTLSLIEPDGGVRLAGAGLLGLALWLLRHDIASRTIRHPGLPRYIALCLLGGYGWLATSGLLALALGAVTAGPAYDAIVHSLFLGFVFAMIFGHLPIIAPLILQRPIAFRPVLYAPLLLLHLSLLLRVGSDLTGWLPGRQWGGLLNALTLLTFAVSVIATLARSRARTDT